MKTIAFRVKGKVQGVFFRKYTQEKALELKLKGWDENLENGDVHGEASGGEPELNAFVRWLWEGSPLSAVEEVQVREISENHLQEYEIR
jgi:acylphosphatase